MQPDLPGYVAPDAIPARTLRTGALVPGIGYGTFSARYSPAEVGAATLDALRMGYRMLDCAAAYGNEPSIGEAIAKAGEYGISRYDLFILGKLPNTMHGRQNVAAACRKSLSDLGLTWLDAYLVHWPVPNALSPDAAKGIYNPESRPYVHEEFMDTWRGMEDLVREGLVRAIGVSNVTVDKLRSIVRDASIPPAINEMEIHPTFQQESLFRFSAENGVLPVAYSPLGSPARPERNRMPGDAVDTQEPAVLEIARARGTSPAAVCIKWAVTRGQVPVPFSIRPTNMLENLQAAAGEPLSAAEMDAMKAAERGSRLARGQGYLWPGAESYHELWDGET